MRQVLRAGALRRPRGMGWGGRREGGLGWGTHVNPWLIHVNVWQKPLQYCKVISLQQINGKKKTNKKILSRDFLGGTVVKTVFPLQEAWAQAPVRELRSCMLYGAAKF